MTTTQKNIIDQLQELTKNIKLARFQNNIENTETETKYSNYCKSIGVDELEYNITDEEREANIGSVFHSPERMDRDIRLREAYTQLKTLVEKLTGETFPDHYTGLELFWKMEKSGIA